MAANDRKHPTPVLFDYQPSRSSVRQELLVYISFILIVTAILASCILTGIVAVGL